MSVGEGTIQQTAQRDTLRIIGFALLVLALVVTGYLSYVKLTNVQMVCVETSTFNCDSVNSSIYSYFPRGNGIPVAYLGFLTWIVIGAILLLENRVAFLQQYGAMLALGIALFGFIFQSCLTYVSATIIGSWCPWCLTAHILIGLMALTQGIRVYRSLFAGR